MDNFRFVYLFQQYVNKACSEEELQEFQALTNKSVHDKQLLALIDELWDKTPLNKELDADRKELILNKIFTTDQQVIRLQKRPFWKGYKIAASLAAAIALWGILHYAISRQVTHKKTEAFITKNDIAPGANKALLTFGDGKTITLNDTKTALVIGKVLKYNDGTAVNPGDVHGGHSHPVPGPQTITTPRGGSYQVILSDGTKVWLNAASSLTYTPNMHGERRVTLDGEAYFEVATAYTSLPGHSMKQPFLVESNGQTVEVLGTHFNVNAYSDEGSIKTTLLEGAVKVSLNGSKNFSLLKPGEQAANSDSQIQVSKANTEQAVAWKNGDFVFKGEDVKSVMRQLARWYDVEIVYKGNVSDIGFVSTISKSKKLSEVITALQATEGIHFKIEGRRVVVMP
uniref:FecR family protein n=1 Tax=Pedobacter schmidteae TaxID=2201271 RepID=UPI000EB3D614|nr:FecR family protein [Pedobacter schmidteae]